MALPLGHLRILALGRVAVQQLRNMSRLCLLPNRHVCCSSVVLGGPSAPPSGVGAQPPPQAPPSAQSMGQAVADISAGLQLMQQSSGAGGLPPWPLPLVRIVCLGPYDAQLGT